MKKYLFLLFFLLTFFAITQVTFAAIGVGVGTGKIRVQDKLKPGIIYELPPLTVINTGDVPSDYEVNVSYHEKQPERRPPEDWFIFSPKKFYLKPKQVKIVSIKINLPIQAVPGNYFAYLEGHPYKKSTSGNTTIGIAAAAKLYFTVVPSNVLSAMYYKAVSFWDVYSPWPQYASIATGIGIVFVLFRKFFNINIGLKKKQTNE